MTSLRGTRFLVMKRLIGRLFWAVALGLLFTVRAYAFTPFVVKDIRVEGLKRISQGTVFNYLPLKIGDRMDDMRSAEVIRALFKTGFFKDVSLERDGGALIIVVSERPAIADIKLSGNKDIETKKLKKSLKGIGFAEGQVFDRSTLEKVEQELRQLYFNRGKYGVRIKTTVTPLPRNRVGIAIKISEGEAAKIRRINIVGNHAYSEKTLLKQFKLGTPNLLSFYTKNDRYSKQKLSGDLERLRSLYMDRGYINFNIDSTQVSLSPDKKDIYITVNITEGHRYTVKAVRLAGDLVLKPSRLFPLVSIRKGDIFSRKAASDTANAISDKLGDAGYAFANVNTIPDIDKKDRAVTLTFYVDPGKRTYVRRINFSGNVKTKDEVLRREMRQMEAAPISTEKVKLSRSRLERLGFFSHVNVKTKPVPGTTDQVDVDYKVTERPSGSLMAGVGFSQTGGLLLNASVSQNNFLGTGNRVSVAFNNSSYNTLYSVDYTNPYYTINGVSRSFSGFYRKTDAAQANLANYTTDVGGGSVTFGIPVSEYDRVRLGLGGNRTTIRPGFFASTQVRDFIARNGGTYNTLNLTTGWIHDTRNRAVFPDSGVRRTLNLDLAIPGSTSKYYRLSFRDQRYIPLTRHITFSLTGDVAYGDTYIGNKEYPIFQNFFAGGIGSVRGYRDNTLGPLDSNGLPLGGRLRVGGSAELLFPPPFVGHNQSVRLSLFVDMGNVYKDVSSFKAGRLRYSAGASLIWLTPFGALNFSLGMPLNASGADQKQPFQFTIGAPFTF
ncbi:outer membrane protein assembly factor BamA precursor [bacterium BMS3Bbin12]|nr:outer membrane protein assembly factor BamA precursor [bacterium BMS3Abin12]GBE48410.1 outer membrane protein assembly factor BamA precursor [bacterium BMS3Bbin12]GBE50555.1 outer membrane protein assembly factor BamA precursor [bacterium BMS3Bbin13]